MKHEAMLVFHMHLMRDACTDNLGFFLGPGRPRSLGGALGSIAGGALLRPVALAPPLFRLPSTLGGGANELGSCSSLAVDGRGVEFDSDVLSALSGGWTEGEGSGLTAAGTSAGNLLRASADRCRMTILLFLADLGVALEADGVVDIVDDGGGDG